MGTLDEGATWFEDPPQTDVIWLSLPPHPTLAEQQQYASDADREAMKLTIDRIVACAVANLVDVLVLPPLGCGAYGCQHPSLDVADIFHQKSLQHAHAFKEMYIACDRPAHLGTSWRDFADAIKSGRPAIRLPQRTSVPPFPVLRKDKIALDEKAR